MLEVENQKPSAVTAQKTRGELVIPHKPKWHQRIGAWAIYALIRAGAATLRYRWNDRSKFFQGEPPGPAIYCVWHNRLPLCMVAYYGYVKKRNRSNGLAALVSASRDGGFLAGILECFGVQPVRGSSSRRGRQALLELTTWAERGYDLAITPDGPRGPRYVVADGVIALAQLTGLPILPVSYYLDWKIQVKSWDRFQIPIPFSRCEMVCDQPIHVPRRATEGEREALRLQLEEALKKISRD